MSLSILNNVTAMSAENQLNLTNTSLQNTLLELSSGSKLNSGADDPAGLSIANGLTANITALTQSATNASDASGRLQVADGALSQVTSLLNQAVTLATESASDTVSDGSQRAALDNEFSSIKTEIDSIGSTTTFNGSLAFAGGKHELWASCPERHGTGHLKRDQCNRLGARYYGWFRRECQYL